jgi:hypothetical protein
MRYHPYSLLLAGLWLSASPAAAAPSPDWLIDPTPFQARVARSKDGRELELSNGLLRRVIRIEPNAATVALDNLSSGESLLRGVKPEAVIEIDGQHFDIGGLKGQPNYAFLRPEWIGDLRPDPAAFRFVGYEIGKPRERMAWNRTRHHAPDVKWPPEGVTLRLDFDAPKPTNGTHAPILHVSVHYELYDGLPCYSKWITLSNGTDQVVRVDKFSSEVLAVVERTSEVDELSEGRLPPNIHIESAMAFGGMIAAAANRRSFRWLADPDFHSQVNYEKKTPCLLADGEHFGLRVGHQIIFPDPQARMHGVPAVVHGTLLPATRATARVGRFRTRDLHQRRHGNFREREHRLALRVAHVVVHDIARAQHHRHAEGARSLERLVETGDDGIDAHGRGLAPVEVPDIHSDDAHPCRINSFGRQRDLSGVGITGLQRQLDRGVGW